MTTIALNVGNFVTLHLNSTNYLLWREQILVPVESQDLVEHILSATSAPFEFDSTINSTSGSIKPNSTPVFL